MARRRTNRRRTEESLWHDEHLVFKVGGKMFAMVLVGGENGRMFSFKCEEETFAQLIETPGIMPTPYLARHQ
ncbi:MAG: MmcQ/YjbR family DNA-binding protein [Verrucomicrobiales bacterium]